MKKAAALACLFLAGASVHAAGVVQVNFVDPERFTDVRDGAYRRDDNLKALEKVITGAAERYVTDGQLLKVDVLDVDLAGEVRPGPRAWDVRVLRGRADWPRIKLRWSLEGGSSGARSGEAVVQDMTYLNRVPPPMADVPLVYERRMLDEWFRKTLGS